MKKILPKAFVLPDADYDDFLLGFSTEDREKYALGDIPEYEGVKVYKLSDVTIVS